MSGHLPRYKDYPYPVDTTGFFDYFVPNTNQSQAHYGDQQTGVYFGIYDYITPAAPAKELRPGPSFFKGHMLPASPSGPRVIEGYSTDWITLLMIICLVLLAWIQTNHSKRLKQIFRSVALPYYTNQLEREGNLYNERITLGLSFVFLTSISLTLFQLIRMEGLQPQGISPFIVFLTIFLGVVLYVQIKTFLVRISGTIFKTSEHAHAYQLNSLIFNDATGIFTFPFLLLVYYLQPEPFIWIVLGIIAILLIYRFIRSIIIGLSNAGFSIFYLILYLCTLEILPFLLMVKLIRQQ